MPPQPHRIAIVTGANKGLGLAIVRQLALRYATSPLATSSSTSTPSSPPSPGSFLIYLTARSRSRGEAALATLHSDPDLKHARCLVQHGGPADIRYFPLDLSPASSSLSDLTTFLRKEHGPSSIDVAINNAGIALDGFNPQVVHDTLETNYWRTHAATRAWLPLMRRDGRVVTVASSVGRLAFYSQELQERFRDARKGEVGEGGEGEGYSGKVDGLMREFEEAVGRGDHEEKGWPDGKAYAVSKAGVIAVTGALARFLEAERMKKKGGEEVFGGTVNCCCPGWVVTDLTKGRGFKTPDQGADLPVKLALGEVGQGVSGEFWRDDEIVEW